MYVLAYSHIYVHTHVMCCVHTYVHVWSASYSKQLTACVRLFELCLFCILLYSSGYPRKSSGACTNEATSLKTALTSCFVETAAGMEIAWGEGEGRGGEGRERGGRGEGRGGGGGGEEEGRRGWEEEIVQTASCCTVGIHCTSSVATHCVMVSATVFFCACYNCVHK